jgi:hypothetical protein
MVVSHCRRIHPIRQRDSIEALCKGFAKDDPTKARKRRRVQEKHDDSSELIGTPHR